VNESACWSNSSVLLLHCFTHQVAPTRKKVTRTGQAEQRSKTGTTDQRANVSLHRIAIIETGCPSAGHLRKARAAWAIPRVNYVCTVSVPVGGALEETRLNRGLSLRLKRAAQSEQNQPPDDVRSSYV